MGDFKVEGGRVTTLDLGGFNELRWCRHGPMLYNKNDIYVGGSLRRYGEFSHGEWELFAQLVSGGDTVVEVGANLGAHTVPLAKRAKRVIAFEPQRLVFQTLCANLALNQLTNVEAYPQAVGSGYRGSIDVAVCPPNQPYNFGGLEMGRHEELDLRYERVPVVCLDQLQLPAMTFLKIDVEGMEQEVLNGGRETIRRHKPIIYCENDRRDRGEALVATLLDLGYDLYWHTTPLFNPLNHASNLANAFPKIVSVNVLAMPNGVAPPQALRPVVRHDDLWAPQAA